MADEMTRVRERVRDKLRADKVKLWLPPFTTDAGLKGEHPTVSWELIALLTMIVIVMLLCLYMQAVVAGVTA